MLITESEVARERRFVAEHERWLRRRSVSGLDACSCGLTMSHNPELHAPDCGFVLEADGIHQQALDEVWEWLVQLAADAQCPHCGGPLEVLSPVAEGRNRVFVGYLECMRSREAYDAASEACHYGSITSQRPVVFFPTTQPSHLDDLVQAGGQPIQHWRTR